jgi:hypothetical protein
VLIRDSVWDSIRTQFTEGEKALLRLTIEGQAICPKGLVINEEALPVYLRAKIEGAVAATPHTEPTR